MFGNNSVYKIGGIAKIAAAISLKNTQIGKECPVQEIVEFLRPWHLIHDPIFVCSKQFLALRDKNREIGCYRNVHSAVECTTPAKIGPAYYTAHDCQYKPDRQIEYSFGDIRERLEEAQQGIRKKKAGSASAIHTSRLTHYD